MAPGSFRIEHKQQKKKSESCEFSNGSEWFTDSLNWNIFDWLIKIWMHYFQLLYYIVYIVIIVTFYFLQPL